MVKAIEPVCCYAAVEISGGLRFVRLWNEAVAERLDASFVKWWRYEPPKVRDLLLTPIGFHQAQLPIDPDKLVSADEACQFAVRGGYREAWPPEWPYPFSRLPWKKP